MFHGEFVDDKGTAVERCSQSIDMQVVEANAQNFNPRRL